MLERARARIAQDMHDDIGAGLTKIAMKKSMRTIIADNSFPFIFNKYFKLNDQVNNLPFVFLNLNLSRSVL